MARNIEIKAQVAEWAGLHRRAAAVASAHPVAIAQDDTFFHCDRGRLKLRDFCDGTGELIFYQRADRAGPEPSFYLRTPTTAPQALRETLAAAWGVAGRVQKLRTLYMAGRTRIHLDRVEGLGDFVELEVVLADEEPEAPALQEARALMQRLHIAPEHLIEGAYVDLLREADSATR